MTNADDFLNNKGDLKGFKLHLLGEGWGGGGREGDNVVHESRKYMVIKKLKVLEFCLL